MSRWPQITALERFWSKVDKNGDVPAHRPSLGPCWEIDVCKSDGYSEFYADGRVHLAHKWIYEEAVGPVGEGLELDHLCRNRGCVNYERHLEPVPHRVNTLRGATVPARHAVKTHCAQGHPFSGTNLLVDSKGYRRCKTCDRENARRRKHTDHGREVAAAYQRQRRSKAKEDG